MSVSMIFRGATTAAVIVLAGLPAAAQDKDGVTTTRQVRAEISEAMDAVANYSEQQSDQALSETQEALSKVDAELEQHQQALRENWAEMSGSAREQARERLRDLRSARNTLGERFGALKSGTGSAWEELKSGFADAWTAFSEVWSAENEVSEAN